MLIRNDNNEHAKIFEEMLNNAQDVYVAVAFLKRSGLELIKESIEKIINGNGSVNFIVGLDLYVTEPKALYELFKLNQKNTKLKLFLYRSTNSTFHPKMYASRGSKKSSVLIGSANLTRSGLSSNVEASIYNDNNDSLFEECKKFFSDLTSSVDCKKASALGIQEYELQYSVFNEEAEKAEETSRQKIVNLAETSLLKKCYEEYRNNKDEMHSLTVKRSNYQEAKLLIEEFNSDRIESKSDFMKVYEKLVGAAGQKKLLHSGSIFRSKNKVAESYQEFLKLTSFLSRDFVLSNSPRVVFEQIIPFKKRIVGLGFNVITEFLNTLEPGKFPVLNKNPIGSVKYLLGEEFKEPGQFKGDDYQAYADFMLKLCMDIRAEDFIETDHFLNFVYWKYAKNET